MSYLGYLLLLGWGSETLSLGPLPFGGGGGGGGFQTRAPHSVRAPWLPPCFPCPHAVIFCWMTLIADSILCLALYLSLRYPESVPLDNDWRNQAPLAFSEHVADGCVVFNQKPVFDVLAAGHGEGVENSSSLFLQISQKLWAALWVEFPFPPKCKCFIRARRFNTLKILTGPNKSDKILTISWHHFQHIFISSKRSVLYQHRASSLKYVLVRWALGLDFVKEKTVTK